MVSSTFAVLGRLAVMKERFVMMTILNCFSCCSVCGGSFFVAVFAI